MRVGGSGAKSVKRGSWSSLVAKMDCREENWTVEDGRVVSFGSVGGDESICSLCLDDFFDFLDFFDGGVSSTSSFCFFTFFRDGSVEVITASPASCSGLMDPSSSATSFFRRLLSLAIINQEIFCGLIDRRSTRAYKHVRTMNESASSNNDPSTQSRLSTITSKNRHKSPLSAVQNPPSILVHFLIIKCPSTAQHTAAPSTTDPQHQPSVRRSLSLRNSHRRRPVPSASRSPRAVNPSGNSGAPMNRI
jgi:hypothetical protein